MLSYRSHLLKTCIQPNLKNSLKFISSNQNYQEIRIPVPWGHIAGKWWGPTDSRPILTVHGWQDNCGSFNRLIPLLNPYIGFLAIDLPGHGYSSRLPSGMYYHYTDYLLTIHYIVNYFKWSKISFMGHSLGGLILSVYSMLFPKSIDLLICIDGVDPEVNDDYFTKIVKHVAEFPRVAQFEADVKEPPSYTLEEIKQKVCIPNYNSIAYENSHHIVERNIAPSKINSGKYFFTRDPRLKLGNVTNWPKEVTPKFAKNVTFPIFLALDSSRYGKAKKDFYKLLGSFKETSVDYQFHEVPGTHHVHLNNPEKLADLINKFIDKHDTTGRDGGGIKEEVIWLKTNLYKL